MRGFTALLLLSCLALFSLVSAQSNVIDVWFIPHSHDDVGWLKTIDQYYDEEVRSIYNTVVEELQKREDRKFIIVEMAFFTMWWAEATQAQKDLVFQYVEKGKVEFVLGGWCMNDDADPTFSASINQMAEGHRFIYETFGVLPRYGWHIDPFGLSSYYPTLFAKMGFNGHVINRIHYQLKDQWKSSQHLEFVWRGSKSLGSETEMFTHVLDSHYSFPSGFNFEKDLPITDSNIASRTSSLVTELKKRSAWFKSKHLLVPGGDDFRWKNAQVQYENWDKLIDYINARSEQYGIRIRYSTLHEYFEAVKAENIEWPVYENDFFPYADNAESYWTGFFTTHSQLKGYIRSRASLLRYTELLGLATQVSKTASGRKGDAEKVLPLRWATAEAQHHDGVTGTSKIHVIDMYYEHLEDGSDVATELLLESASYLVENNQGAPSLTETPVSIENLRPGQFAPIIVSNALGWSIRTIHEFVTTRSDIFIVDENGAKVRSQVAPYPFSDDGVERFQVFFEVNLPPAGFETYYATTNGSSFVEQKSAAPNGVFFENDVFFMNVTDIGNALSFEVRSKRDGTSMMFQQEIMEYTSYTGAGQKSGAYIFRPTGSATRVSGLPTLSSIDGDLVQLIYYEIDATHFQVYRLYKLPGQNIENLLEVQFGLGPLKPNAEVIARFSTSLTGTTLYSDNNGIEMRKRPAATGLIQQNYYPMVAQAYLANTDLQFGLFSERTVGVASLASGQIEVMLHRRCSMDDGRGMGEALDDDTMVFPTLRISMGARRTTEEIRPPTSLRFQHRPMNLFGPILSNLSAWTQNYRTKLALMKYDLPTNVHLLAFKVVSGSNWQKATVRFQHIYEVDSHPTYSLPAILVLEDIFDSQYEVSPELELSGMTPMISMERMSWTSQFPDDSHVNYWDSVKTELQRKERDAIQLNPMQIKTYEYTF